MLRADTRVSSGNEQQLGACTEIGPIESVSQIVQIIMSQLVLVSCHMSQRITSPLSRQWPYYRLRQDCDRLHGLILKNFITRCYQNEKTSDILGGIDMTKCLPHIKIVQQTSQVQNQNSHLRASYVPFKNSVALWTSDMNLIISYVARRHQHKGAHVRC